MPPRLTKPANAPGHLQPLIDLLWTFHSAAGLPTTKRIAEVIEGWEHRKASAGQETIRKTLRAETVGEWHTVEVIFLALCEIADIDADDVVEDEYPDRFDPPALSHRVQLRQCWYQARTGAPMPDIPRTRAERAKQEAAQAAEREARKNRASTVVDPWGGTDEPPF
jgi:hypothetical protein